MENHGARGRLVLVIEDDPLNRQLMRALLGTGGLKSIEADNASDGLALAAREHPDCIVMDVRLPGIDGFEATRRLKADPTLKAIPVIAVTGYADVEDEQRAVDAGCDAYLTKPFPRGVFVSAVRRLIEGPAPELAPSRIRLLVVDDEPAVLGLMAARLRMEGYEVLSASGGDEAIRIALLERPDLVLLDLVMPGTDGFAVTRRLRRNAATAGIPIILVTGLAQSGDRLKGLQEGADEFLTKPVDQTELVVRIKSLLRVKQYQEQLRLRAASGEEVASRASAPDGSGGSPPLVLVARVDNSGMRALDSVLSQGYRVSEARSGGELLLPERLSDVDILVLDSRLRDPGTDEICATLRRHDQSSAVPVIVVLASDDPEARIRLLSAGASDVVLPGADERELAVRVSRLVGEKRDREALELRYRTALNAATRDTLTGLFNHGYFLSFLELELKRSERKGHPTALLIIDLDDFKAWNDSLGHPAGDAILREVAERIHASLREIDVPVRYGGDEFAVVLPYTERAGALAVAERIRDRIGGSPIAAGEARAEIMVTTSIGIAICPEHASHSHELLQAADAMLYKAKNTGKNCISMAPRP